MPEPSEPWASAPEVHVHQIARAFPTPRPPHLSPIAAGQSHLAQARLLVDQVWREAFFAGMVYESARKPAVMRIEPDIYDRMMATLDTPDDTQAIPGSHGQSPPMGDHS